MDATRSGAGRLRSIARAAWEFVLLELALYACLLRWIVRRPDVPAGARRIDYDQLSGPMIWLWIFGSTAEVIVVEVVLRVIDAAWAEALRLPLLALGIWGVVWMVGMRASYRVKPHLLTADELVLRSGARTRVSVPLAAIASARPAQHELPGLVRSLHRPDGPDGAPGDLLLVGVSSQTNLEIVLDGPTRVTCHGGDKHGGGMEVTRAGVWVDDPRAVIALLREQISEPRTPRR